MPSLSVEKLFKERKELLDLTLLAGDEGLSRPIQTNEIFRPGLALAGYTDRFAHQRVQVLGETELTYLHSLTPQERIESLTKVTAFAVPLLIATKGIAPPIELLDISNRSKITALVDETFHH